MLYGLVHFGAIALLTVRITIRITSCDFLCITNGVTLIIRRQYKNFTRFFIVLLPKTIACLFQYSKLACYFW